MIARSQTDQSQKKKEPHFGGKVYAVSLARLPLIWEQANTNFIN